MVLVIIGKRLSLCLLLAVGSLSCSAAQYDQSLIGQCFDIVRDSYLFQYDSCGENQNAECASVQAYGLADNDWEKQHYPQSEAQVLGNQKYWAKAIRESASLNSRKVGRFMGTLNANVKIEVTFLSARGSVDKFWQAEAVVVEGKHKGLLLALPARHHLVSPAWVTGYPVPGKVNELGFDPRFLKLCMG